MKDDESTSHLLKLCAGYFFFYVLTGILVKVFQGSPELGFFGMSEWQYLIYNTFGSSVFCLSIAGLLGWMHFNFDQRSDFYFLIPSGICTAVVIPATTLLYSLPISVMVAMIIMRGSIILVSRAVDSIQIRQGILKRQVYWEENTAVVFSIIALSIPLFFSSTVEFDFIHNVPAMVILISYIVAYALRIYIMNYFKNTRAKDSKSNNHQFFAIEQIFASIVLVFGCSIVFSVMDFEPVRAAILTPHSMWAWGLLSGTVFGAAAFFSVFLFMFKGRTSTFATLVNRLTSLIAGTTSTLLLALIWGTSFPKQQDWISLLLILGAVWFLTRAEKKRFAELKASR